MTRIEIQAKIEVFRRELRTLEAIKISCGTCEHGANGGWCQRFQAAPPEDVQAVGCDDYVYDCVPF